MTIRPLFASLLMPALLAPLGATGCHQHDPLEGVGAEAVGADQADAGQSEAGQSEASEADLPCAGADLQTDDLNCGVCGHECAVLWPGTDYAAGGCAAGECGPVWSTLLPLDPEDPPTCAEVCGYGERECVPAGCSGKTAFVCLKSGGFGQECDLEDPFKSAATDLSGSCDDLVPFPANVADGVIASFRCCCERPS